VCGIETIVPFSVAFTPLCRLDLSDTRDVTPAEHFERLSDVVWTKLGYDWP